MKQNMSIPKLAAVLLASCFLTGAALASGKPAPLKPVSEGTKQLYQEQCASCHGADRMGGTGPAVFKESVQRLRGKSATATIQKGRVQTQMPAFEEDLSDEQISGLVDFIKTPLPVMPVWGETEIMASRVLNEDYKPVEKPVYDSDPLNLFIVVETGDHYATVMDGDTFEPLTRFKTQFALHGGPKFTPDGRYVFFMSRDGWITKFDMWALKVVAEVRGGINSRNVAISKDGKHIALANYLPHSLVMFSAEDLSVEKIFETKSKLGISSRVSAVYQAPERDSFVVALKDVPEIWEVMTDPNAGPQYEGYVHTYEKGMVEALPSSEGLFALRRIAVDKPMDDFFFDPSYRHLVGSARDGKTGVVVNLDVGRAIAELPLPGFPHLGSGISWEWQGRQVMATPHLRENKISVIDMSNWTLLKTIETAGPGFFMRSHENSKYAWSGVFFGPNKDLMYIIDKETLEIVKTLQPMPGKTAAHIEFDRDGSHAVMSIWEDDGAIIIYDAKTLEEVKRLPMSKPSGKYNVWNKISFSAGTSH